MIENSENLCLSCMKPLEGQKICPHCGAAADAPHNSDHLKPGTLLRERYLVGRALRSNGESVRYMGYDTEEEFPVWIDEFFPRTLADRQPDGSVTPKEGSELPFKSLCSDFEELLQLTRKLSGQRGTPIQLDYFSINGTLCGVYRPIEARSLEQCLRKEGPLSWDQAKEPLLALCALVQRIHKEGTIHGGLSPETILLDKKGCLWLDGFATPSLRTEHTEIPDELFPGYSAPEQLTLSGWQGPWTDVYAIGAVAYRMLSGKQPFEAAQRVEGRRLPDLHQEHPELPLHVVRAIEAALSLDTDQRTHNLDVFTAGLLAEELSPQETDEERTVAFSPIRSETAPGSEPTMIVDPSALRSAARRDPEPQPKPEPVREPQHSPSGKKAALVLGAGLCILAAFCVMLAFVFSPDKTPAPPASSEPEPPPVQRPQYEERFVPNFKGMYVSSITSSLEYTDQFEFWVRQEYSEEYPSGVVLRQAPAPDVKMLHKGTVILTVSKGPVQVPMPNLVGSTIQFAMEVLSDMEITYDVEEVDDPGFEPGIVGRTSISGGAPLNKLTDRVLLTIGRTSTRPVEQDDDD